MVVSIAFYRAVNGDHEALRDNQQSVEELIDAREIIDACTWYFEDDNLIKVAIPPLYLVTLR